MKKNFFIFLLIVVLKSALHSQQPDGILYFGNGKATLSSESTTKLKDLADKIKKSKNTSVVISGFTNANGSAESNLALSKKRALSVSDYFMKNGIEKTQITIQFFGEDKPVAQKEKDLRENRRVEIMIGPIRTNNEKTSPGIFGKLWKQPDKLIFSETKVASNEDLTMTTGSGTTIWIAPNSLCRPNGELARGDISIELTDYYKKSDMLLANLHTASDSVMLETGGMIKVVARCRGEVLSLKKGSKMRIGLPGFMKEQDMHVFIGSAAGKQINWKQQADNEKSVILYNPFVDAGRNQGYDSSSAQEMSKIERLVLSAGSLGWINCDRFTKIENKTNLSVEIDPTYHAVVRLVFKDLNAIMPGYNTVSGVSRVINIPLGQRATIVAFGMIKETPYFISKDIVISENEVEKLVPKITSFEALQIKLKKVN